MLGKVGQDGTCGLSGVARSWDSLQLLHRVLGWDGDRNGVRMGWGWNGDGDGIRMGGDGDGNGMKMRWGWDEMGMGKG